MEPVTIEKDYSSISYSARWLLLLKGYTNIPFAKEVAELLEYPNKYIPDFEKRDFTFWAGVFHFESRYWSIEQLLKDLPTKNILEISSGYSFRSLDYALNKGIYYIDTDLPEIINTKKGIIQDLTRKGCDSVPNLELVPLNALDKNSYYEILSHFPKGEIAIVNEGLLTYLDKQEQKQVCSIIHDILIERGGYWITADIYLKNKQPKLNFKFDTEQTEFYKQHNTEKNSFENFKEAEKFFKEMGFVIEGEAKIKNSEMSSFKYLKKSISLRQFFRLLTVGKVQATWRLKAV